MNELRKPAIEDFRRSARRALDAMGAQGIQVDDDGDFRFERQGLSFLLVLDDNEPGYLRLLLPCLAEALTPEARAPLLEACSNASASVKMAKVFFVGNDLCAGLETLVVDPQALDAKYLERILSTTVAAAAHVASELKGGESLRRAGPAVH